MKIVCVAAVLTVVTGTMLTDDLDSEFGLRRE
jgi:uncharacterized membrane-anchored protein